MAIKKVSKAIAGMVASIAAAWVTTLWGFQIPPEAIEWGTGALATLIAGGLGFAVTYISPANDPS